eukprot:gene16896-20075_t
MEAYWSFLPPSSIDFCEPNYVSSIYVAEPANTISSLPLAWAGFVGFLRCLRRPVCTSDGFEQAMFCAMYLVLGFIGSGSAALHATLSARGQAFDELPMLLLNVLIIAFLSEHGSPPGKLKRPQLLTVILAVSAVEAIVYLCLQQFYAIFLVLYLSTVLILISWSTTLALCTAKKFHEERIRTTYVRPIYFLAIFSYVLCGGIAWLTDMIFCDAVLASLGAFFLHPLWHIGALIGTLLTINLLAAARCGKLSISPKVEWSLGMPFVVGEEIGKRK